ncbi:MAG: thermonuclease family protein [Ancalomicrobiaceae bacterium]|nr:thermonuclease family protein [Ancalomicrobiaceae bacterium]
MRETGSSRLSAHRPPGQRLGHHAHRWGDRQRLDRGKAHARRATIRTLLAVLLVGAPQPLFAAGPSPGPLPQAPVWTLEPTHIDRQNDHRERIEIVGSPQDRLTLMADRPIRLRPDGSFSADGLFIRIYGIELPPRNRICELPSGGRWACGMRATAVFISKIGGKALVCRSHSARGADIMLADCASRGKDLARQMVGEGWATADALADAELKAIEADARAKGLGLWQQTLPDF